MKKVITNIESYIEYFKENLNEINQIIFRQFGIYPNKLKKLNIEEKEMLQIPLTKVTILGNLLDDLTQGKDMDFDTEDLEESFLVNAKSSFLEVINYENNRLVASYLESQVIETLKTTEDLEIDKGDLIFAFIYKDREETYLYKNFVILNEEEVQRILDVFSEYYVENELDVYFDNVIVQRLMKKYLDDIDSVLNKYNAELSTKFNQEALFNFFKHIGNVAKFNFNSNKNIDLFQIDYFDFLTKEGIDGNFVVEGELENFLEILEFLIIKESKSQDKKLEALKSIKYSLDNIFVLKNNITKNHPLTPVDLIYDIEDIIERNSYGVVDLSTLGFFIETLSEMDRVKITNKTKRLSTKTIREYCQIYFSSVIDENNNVDPKIKTLLELAFSVIIGNDLGGVDEENNLYLKNRYNFFVSNNPPEYLANIINGVFREETLENFIGKKNLNYNKLLDSLKNSIVNESFYQLEETDEGKKLLKILTTLGIVTISYLNDYKHYRLEVLGEYLKERFAKKTEKAKVLQLNR